jgi:hypothetical protein
VHMVSCIFKRLYWSISIDTALAQVSTSTGQHQHRSAPAQVSTSTGQVIAST